MGLKKRSVASAQNLYNRMVKAYTPKGLTKSIYPIIRRRWLEIIYLIILFSLTAGVVNAMLEGSKPIYIYAIILSSRSVQTWSEAVINLFTIILGTLGVYLMYQSGRQSVRRRASDLYFILGLILMILVVFIGFSLLAEKGF